MADEAALPDQTWKVGDPAPPLASKKKAPTKAGSNDPDVQVSAMVRRSLKLSLEARARAEDRTLGVVIRRALLAYQRDWNPDEADADD